MIPLILYALSGIIIAIIMVVESKISKKGYPIDMILISSIFWPSMLLASLIFADWKSIGKWLRGLIRRILGD